MAQDVVMILDNAMHSCSRFHCRPKGRRSAEWRGSVVSEVVFLRYAKFQTRKPIAEKNEETKWLRLLKLLPGVVSSKEILPHKQA